MFYIIRKYGIGFTKNTLFEVLLLVFFWLDAFGLTYAQEIVGFSVETPCIFLITERSKLIILCDRCRLFSKYCIVKNSSLWPEVTPWFFFNILKHTPATLVHLCGLKVNIDHNNFPILIFLIRFLHYIDYSVFFFYAHRSNMTIRYMNKERISINWS